MKKAKRIEILLLFALIFCIKANSQTTAQITGDNVASCFIGDWEMNRSIQLKITSAAAGIWKYKFRTYLYKDDSLKIETDFDTVPLIVMNVNDTFYPEHFFAANTCIFYDGFDDYLFDLGNGRLPSGNYKIKIEIYKATVLFPNPILAFQWRDSMLFQIDPYQAPGATSPYNKSKIASQSGNQVIFQWYPVVPTPNFAVSYKLYVKEKQTGQTVWDAWKLNSLV